MKKTGIALLLVCSLFSFNLIAQNSIINKAETERIEKYLSSDELEGRRTFSKSIDKAADFIANEFKQSGLATFKNSGTYLQPFSRLSARFISASGNFDGAPIDTKNLIVVTAQPSLSINETSGYEIVKINKEDNFGMIARKYIAANKNYIVLVDESFASNFGRLVQLKSNITAQQKTVVFVMGAQAPLKFTIEASHKIEDSYIHSGNNAWPHAIPSYNCQFRIFLQSILFL